MIDLCGLTLDELRSECVRLGEPEYRAGQIFHWVYRRRVFHFAAMTDLSKSAREKFQHEVRILSTQVAETVEDPDGTVKLLVRIPDGHGVECVLIPQGERVAGCVSSQVGCAVGCLFCASGMGGLVRNLTTAEIVEQVMHLESRLAVEERLDNLVFMGVGEPLANYEALVRAIRILNDREGLGLAARRQTVSTVGVPGTIERLSREGLQVNLAISLHAADDKTRAKMIPRTNLMTVSELVAASELWREKTGRDVTFEYVLVSGVNDSRDEAYKMAGLLRGKPVTVNVIELNPVAQSPWKPPAREKVREFVNTLRGSGINVTHRKRMGIQANAACGQLRLKRAGQDP